MEHQDSPDASYTSRTSDRVGRWASMASTGHPETTETGEMKAEMSYGQADARLSAYNRESHLQTPMAQHRGSFTSQMGGGGAVVGGGIGERGEVFYNQSGYTQSGIAAYDPTRLPSHMSRSSFGSKSSNLDQSSITSPNQANFYSSPLPANAQQPNISAFPAAPFSHYQQQQQQHQHQQQQHQHQQPTASPPDYQNMRSMSAEMNNITGVATMVDPHIHQQNHAINSSPLSSNTSSSQYQHGPISVDSGSIYYQQYPSQSGQYYYPGSMMTGMQPSGGYFPPQQNQQSQQQLQNQHHLPPQQYSSASYNVYPTQYAGNPYPSQPQQASTFYASPRPDWFHSNRQQQQQQQQQQQWRPAYYPQHSMSTNDSTSRRNSRTSSNNRSSKGASLPMRPRGISNTMRASSANTSLDISLSALDSPLEDSIETSNERTGLRPQNQPHPHQGPRSDHVLWCGNVPSDASEEELWSLFSRLPMLDDDDDKVEGQGEGGRKGGQIELQVMEEQEKNKGTDHGVMSIFIIARSNCAFVNYASARHLQKAVKYFHGQSLRPNDIRCPKLVCRVRKKDDEAQAGVAGQRGKGIHVAWVKEQDRKMKKQKSKSISTSEDKDIEGPTLLSPSSSSSKLDDAATSSLLSAGLPLSSSEDPNSSTSTLSETGGIPLLETTSKSEVKPYNSAISIDSSSGSISHTSTTSSLLRHPAFHERFFILKSLSMEDLDRSIQTGTWATQTHNEQVLDQAFRNSETVFLIFSANQSGGFFGYARMTGETMTATERQQQQQQQQQIGLEGAVDSQKRATMNRPDVIPEGDEANTDYLAAPRNVSQSKSTPADAPIASPLPITPNQEPVESKVGLSKGSTLLSKEDRNEKDFIATSSHLLPSDALLDEGSTLTATAPSGVVMSADGDEPSLSTIMTRVPVAMDENGVRRKDMMVEALVHTSGGTIVSKLPASEVGTIGPSDSVSFDSSAQNQLAMRALINNLRLEERESHQQAKKLEESMESATIRDVPKVESTDSFGKPFKIEWIKTTPLSFSHVKRLRNPWRDNRQIKVSRDGTELEPNTGRQLLKEWQRVEDGIVGLAAISRIGDDEDEDEDA